VSDSKKNIRRPNPDRTRGGAGDGGGYLAPEKLNKAADNTEWAL